MQPGIAINYIKVYNYTSMARVPRPWNRTRTSIESEIDLYGNGRPLTSRQLEWLDQAEQDLVTDSALGAAALTFEAETNKHIIRAGAKQARHERRQRQIKKVAPCLAIAGILALTGGVKVGDDVYHRHKEGQAADAKDRLTRSFQKLATDDGFTPVAGSFRYDLDFAHPVVFVQQLPGCTVALTADPVEKHFASGRKPESDIETYYTIPNGDAKALEFTNRQELTPKDGTMICADLAERGAIITVAN
ncbi:MAG: hypothetical protein JWM81_177 [Candidatus Saccharibacteria bacterium]|nr:hypothetical protein [Candidatus Saccharibacteria bacterium]